MGAMGETLVRPFPQRAEGPKGFRLTGERPMNHRIAAIVIGIIALVSQAAAQEAYPAKPVRMIVPYAAGGNADIFGRTLAQKLGDALKQPFVVENRAGANGGIGADFVAKAAPDGYTPLVTANGPSGGNHLAGELFALATGTQLTHVPYKGSAPALADLLGGQLTFMFDTVITSVPQIRAGKLRAFAVSSGKRASSLPEVPTMQEAGIGNFVISPCQREFS